MSEYKIIPMGRRVDVQIVTAGRHAGFREFPTVTAAQAWIDAQSSSQEGNAVGAEGTQYVVVENTPGYMPENDDPFVTSDYAQAVAYLNDRAAEYADDGYRVEYGWASGNNYAAVMVWDDSRSHDLGRYIGIELDESGES